MKCNINKLFSIKVGLVLAGFLQHPVVLASPPQAGDPAPALGLEKLLQASDGAKADWKSLRGQVVVLEFWATWCGPCVASIPALNKLEDSYKNKAVRFISITDEQESTVKAFLKKKPIRGWIGIDSDRSAFKAFGVSGRPTLIIVDQHGKLVGKLSLFELVREPGILDDLLAGKTRRFDRPRTSGLDLSRDLGQDIEGLAGSETRRPLCLIAIRRAQPMRETLGGQRREFLLSAAPLRRVIARIYRVSEMRVTGAALPPEEEKYDVIFVWPKGNLNAGEALLRQAVETTFDLRIRRAEQMMDVYVLGVCDGTSPSWKPKTPGMLIDPVTKNVAPTDEILKRMNAGEAFFGALGDTRAFADNLSYALNRPVVDEASIEGYYAFFFPYDIDKPNPAGLIETVRTKYGLKLTSEKRKIEVLVVEDASRDASTDSMIGEGVRSE